MGVGLLVLEAGDVEALEDCCEGSCDVQLPTVAMEAFHDGVIWSQPGAAQKANALFRPMVLQLLLGEDCVRPAAHHSRAGDVKTTLAGVPTMISAR